MTDKIPTAAEAQEALTAIRQHWRFRDTEAAEILQAFIAARPDPSRVGEVSVSRDDLRLVLNPPATQDWKSTALVAEAEARLSDALTKTGGQS